MLNAGYGIRFNKSKDFLISKLLAIFKKIFEISNLFHQRVIKMSFVRWQKTKMVRGQFFMKNKMVRGHEDQPEMYI